MKELIEKLEEEIKHTDNINIGLVIGIIILFGIIIYMLFVDLSYDESINKEVYNNCLEQIAINFCKEEGLVYKYYPSDFYDKKFSCVEGRKKGYTEYTFYDEELNNCENAR